MTETPTTIDLGDGITAALLPFSDVELTLPCGTNMLVTFVEEGTTHGDLLGLIRENLASDDPMFTNELNVDGKPVQVAGPWWRECEGEHHHRRHKTASMIANGTWDFNFKPSQEKTNDQNRRTQRSN